MPLTWREENHKQRGHYHFDWDKKTKDVRWYPKKFPKSACDDLVSLVLEREQQRGLNPRDPVYEKQSVANLDIVRYGYEESQSHCVERNLDRAESIDQWRDTGMDMHSTWGTTLSAKRDPVVYDRLNHYITQYNWFGTRKMDFEHKFWIQYPGQKTICHMDHIYDFYDGRTRWDDPKRTQKMVMYLTPWEPGHYMCWGSEMMVDWEQGSGFTWDWGLPHWTANFGKTPRVTLAFSVKGLFTEEELTNGMGERV